MRKDQFTAWYAFRLGERKGDGLLGAVLVGFLPYPEARSNYARLVLSFRIDVRWPLVLDSVLFYTTEVINLSDCIRGFIENIF